MPIFAEVMQSEADQISRMLGQPLSTAAMANQNNNNNGNQNNNNNNNSNSGSQSNNSNNSSVNATSNHNNNNSGGGGGVSGNPANSSNSATCYVGLESLPGLFASNDGDGPYNEFYFSETSHALRVLQGSRVRECAWVCVSVRECA